MLIKKYKKLSNGQYKLFLDDDSEICLYEDVILKYNLLLDKSINPNLKKDIELYNNLCDVYYVSIRSLRNRFRSTKELRDLLLKKGYLIEDIDAVIKKLLDQGYLNDDSFCKSYINSQMITSSRGPLKITKELLSKGVSIDIINNNIDVFTVEQQVEKITKIVNKLIKSNKTRGGNILKKKILTDLVNLGYDPSLVSRELTKYNFNVGDDIYKREYDKLYKKYSRKYEGRELEYKIKEKLYQKGLYYEN